MLEIKGRTVILLLKTDLQFFTFINLHKNRILDPAAEKGGAHHAGLTPNMVTSLRAILRLRPHLLTEVARQMTPTSKSW